MSGVLRVTADSNIYVSALNLPGNPARILEMAEEGSIRLAVSDDILSEVARVLRRPKFGWSHDQIAQAINQISALTEHIEPKQKLDVVRKTLRTIPFLNARSRPGPNTW